MKKLFFVGLALFSLLNLFSPVHALSTGQAAPDFQLNDSQGNSYKLGDFGKFVVLEWTNYDCPFVKKHYRSNNMQTLQKQYTSQGVIYQFALPPGNKATLKEQRSNKEYKKKTLMQPLI